MFDGVDKAINQTKPDDDTLDSKYFGINTKSNFVVTLFTPLIKKHLS